MRLVSATYTTVHPPGHSHIALSTGCEFLSKPLKLLSKHAVVSLSFQLHFTLQKTKKYTIFSDICVFYLVYVSVPGFPVEPHIFFL